MSVSEKVYEGLILRLQDLNAELAAVKKREQETVNQLIDKTALLAAANERAGKLSRQLVELQDAIDSRDKAAGFEMVPAPDGSRVLCVEERPLGQKDEANVEVTRLRAWAARRGHFPTCARLHPFYPSELPTGSALPACTCGLDAVLASDSGDEVNK